MMWVESDGEIHLKGISYLDCNIVNHKSFCYIEIGTKGFAIYVYATHRKCSTDEAKIIAKKEIQKLLVDTLNDLQNL